MLAGPKDLLLICHRLSAETDLSASRSRRTLMKISLKGGNAVWMGVRLANVPAQ